MEPDTKENLSEGVIGLIGPVVLIWSILLFSQFSRESDGSETEDLASVNFVPLV